MPGIMLVGYDVEEPDPATTQHFLTQACRLHDDLGFPATLFVVGRTLQHSVPAFREIAQDPLFNLQQHTYSHKLLKTVCIDDGKSVRIVRGETLETIRDEVRRTNTLLAELLGITCTGITGPWCYYRGLRDRPDILEVLWEEGIRFTRTDGRNAQDWHPVALDLQPYWYEAQGFPKMLEVPIHGWHDCVLRDAVLGWDDLDGYVADVRGYLDRAAADDRVYSLCSHDWSSIRADPDLSATRRILEAGLALGLKPMTYAAYYEQRVREQRLAVPA
jgi:peptidoglycan/xylan/chitin deacetylase (PgdA/CDA1 family)